MVILVRPETGDRVVQSLNSPFFPPPIGAEPGWVKRESRITCMRMLRTPPFFPPNRGKNHIRKYFPDSACGAIIIIVYKQQFLYSDWLKTCQLMPNQWNFTSATLNCIRFVFCHNIKDNKRNLCQDLLTIENTNSDLKVHALQMSYLYASDFHFKNCCKLAQHGETIRKKWLRVQTRINHISILTFLCFFTTISTSKKLFIFIRVRAEKGIARHIDASSVV